MAWVRFRSRFDWSPAERPGTLIAFPAGDEGSVRASCAQAAVAAGKAEKVPTPGHDPNAVRRGPPRRRA